MEQKLTKEQCIQILEELREIKRIMATKEDIGKIEKESREIRKNMAKGKAILEAYGMPTFSRGRCRNVWRPFYCGEDGINSTRCSSTGYRY